MFYFKNFNFSNEKNCMKNWHPITIFNHILPYSIPLLTFMYSWIYIYNELTVKNIYTFQALRLSKKALGESTIGQMVNLLSNDVSRFDFSTIFIHYLWCGPLQFLIIMYLTWLRWGFIYTFWFSLLSTSSILECLL